MKLVTVIGARPQFIKVGAVSNKLRVYHDEILVHTGQHYDENMSDIFFTELNIPKPDYNLEVGSFSHGAQTGRMLEKIEKILLKEKPDLVMVYGDTNSTLAAALAASKLLIPIVHVEAGIRVYDKTLPEEQNRILTDHLSTLLLCATNTSVFMLKQEGITEGVYNIGDVMFDVALKNISIAKKKYSEQNIVHALLRIDEVEFSKLPDRYYLATVHRASNTNLETLTEILSAFEKLDYPVLMLTHPRTEKVITTIDYKFGNIIFLKPAGYLETLWLISNSKMVLTDSGGLQREAYFLSVPCTTLLPMVIWPETMENGWNCITELNEVEILKAINREFDSSTAVIGNPFGNGQAADKLIEIINNYDFHGGKNG